MVGLPAKAFQPTLLTWADEFTAQQVAEANNGILRRKNFVMDA